MVRARKIPVKMFRAEVHQNGKATFYFASENRIDFRDLVRDLGNELRLRVELRQVGVRDEAKMVGGIGSCGLELCCSTFLPRFAPVSIKMAKHQNLVLNPTKVSGQCGRLKCCLVYEEANYVEAAKALPKLGKRVSTPEGEGRVADLDVLHGRVRVYFQDGPPQVFSAEQVKQLGPPPGSGAGAGRARARRRAAPRRAQQLARSRRRGGIDYAVAPAMDPFYITTPIYYVNALPHLGTFYSTVVADAMARYHRARGSDTFFLTGLDEHGLKIHRIAQERGIKEQAYCDEIAAKFQETWKRMEIGNDDFIRTTQERHKKVVAEMWNHLKANGDIESREYEGLYCVGCEEFKGDDEVVVEDGKKLCPIHRTPVEAVKERNYFFRLSKYADRLLDWYKSADPIWPESRRNEVASFVSRGLKDISISRLRKSVEWGIDVPGDKDHLIYVWIDALTNYYTAATVGPNGEARQWWNGSAHHVIAKDILRFHAVYWPAMLMSVGLPLPKRIFCHGYLTVKGQKISKSIPATRVDPNAIVGELGDGFVDPLRYFVLREYTLGGDGDFTYEALFQRYESDLGNDLGNLLNRTVSMAHRYLEGRVPQVEEKTFDQHDPAATEDYWFVLRGEQLRAGKRVAEAWEQFSPSVALQEAWSIVRRFNAFIEEQKPWKLAKDLAHKAELVRVLNYCCESLRWAALMVAPAMPVAAAKILSQLGLDPTTTTWPTDWSWPGATLGKPEPLFPRIEPERQTALIAKWMPAADATAAPATAATAAATPPAPAATSHALAAAPAEIAMDEFAKIDLRVAKVLTCERVPKADKLLKLTLDVGAGAEPRTVVSGIASAYQPEQMVGRTVIYLANLKPAKIRGVLSQGMILAAGDADVLALSALDRDAPPGTKVR